MRWKWIIPIVILIAAVGLFLLLRDEDEPEIDSVVTGDIVYRVDFDSPDDFEVASFDSSNLQLAIENSQYRIRSLTDGAGYLWGKSVWEGAEGKYPPLKNVIVTVEAHPQAGGDDNWYGVMCRLDQRSFGYAFLVSSDGFWTIARSEDIAGVLNLRLITPWEQSGAINQGYKANTIEAHCVEDYLALYVNGEFVGDHRDDKFDVAGAVGLFAGGGENKPVEVIFDDLIVREAYLDGQPNTPLPPTVSPVPATETPEPQPTLEPAPLGDSPTLESVPLGEPTQESFDTPFSG